MKKALHNPYLGLVLFNKLLTFYYSHKRKYYYLIRKLLVLKAEHLCENKDIVNQILNNLDSISVCDKNLYCKQFSHKQSIILEEADNHIVDKYRILGSDWTSLKKLDWHRDNKTGFIWRKGKFYRSYKLVNFKNNADVKFPWELSRGHQFLKLGQAYLLTHDEKYADKFKNDISSWIRENPYMQSINWTCSMEVGIRAVNWIFALAMLKNSPQIDDEFNKKILVSLYLHGYFIFRNPEKNAQNNHNHYLADLVGQIHIGLLFKSVGESSMWLEVGKNELFREIRNQILPSGVDYERSINYHRLVLELLSYTVIVLKKNKIEVPSDILYRIEKMFEFVMYYTKPDGTAPVIGDQDDGRLLPFGYYRNIDHRYLLAIGAVLFNRDDFRIESSGYNPECFFLFGADSSIFFERADISKRGLNSIGFKDAGFFIMRKENSYMFINHSGKGRYNELNSGTHTHSDLLSFDLYSKDKSFIVDPGSYVYSANPAERMKFRSTYMHNTIVVDGNNQNILTENNLWDFKRNAIPVLNQWVTNENEDIFEGTHNGFDRLEDPVIHARKIIFNKTNLEYYITDKLTGSAFHTVDWYFHFDENIDLKEGSKYSFITKSSGSNIRIDFQTEHSFTSEILYDFISKAYGEKTQAKVLKIQIKERCPISVDIKISTIL